MFNSKKIALTFGIVGMFSGLFTATAQASAVDFLVTASISEEAAGSQPSLIQTLELATTLEATYDASKTAVEGTSVTLLSNTAPQANVLVVGAQQDEIIVFQTRFNTLYQNSDPFYRALRNAPNEILRLQARVSTCKSAATIMELNREIRYWQYVQRESLNRGFSLVNGSVVMVGIGHRPMVEEVFVQPRMGMGNGVVVEEIFY